MNCQMNAYYTLCETACDAVINIYIKPNSVVLLCQLTLRGGKAVTQRRDSIVTATRF